MTKKSGKFLNAEVEKSTREFSDGLNFSIEVSAAVAAASLGSTYYFIGITDRINDNDHYYESTSTSVSSGFVGTLPWASGEPKAIVFNGDCAAISTVKTWVIQQCTTTDMAICEKP